MQLKASSACLIKSLWYVHCNAAVLMHAQDRVRNNPKVTVHLNTAVLDVFGDGRSKENTQGSPLKGVRIRNTQVS